MDLTKKAPKTIPNWGVFNNHFIAIHLYEYYDEDEDPFYQSALLFLLEDGRPLKHANESRAIILMTDISAETPRDCIIETISAVKYAFNDIAKMSLVFNNKGDMLEEIDISDLLEDDYDSEQIFMAIEESKNKTIH